MTDKLQEKASQTARGKAASAHSRCSEKRTVLKRRLSSLEARIDFVESMLQDCSEKIGHTTRMSETPKRLQPQDGG